MTDTNEFPIEGKGIPQIPGTSENPEYIKRGGNKSKKKILLISLLAVILIVSVAGIGFANKFRHFREDGPLVFMMEKVTEGLNLSDQQKKDVQQIKDEVKAKMESKKSNRESGMSDFENAFRQDNLDKATLNSIAEKRQADREEMKSFMEDELIKFHSILTPDQRNKVADKVKDMRENHRFWDKDDKKHMENN
jgi:protein CpxP